jgi:hypothetical protein
MSERHKVSVLAESAGFALSLEEDENVTHAHGADNVADDLAAGRVDEAAADLGHTSTRAGTAEELLDLDVGQSISSSGLAHLDLILEIDGPTETKGLLLAARGRERKKGRGRQKPAAHKPAPIQANNRALPCEFPDFVRIAEFSSWP